MKKNEDTMKRSFEKFSSAQKYIAEKNYSALSDMLHAISETHNDSFFNATGISTEIKHFEYVADTIIMDSLDNMLLTDPDFFADQDFRTLFLDILNNIFHADWSNSEVNFDYSLMSCIKTEKRMDFFKLTFRRLKKTFRAAESASEFMEKIVWYAAFENDSTLLEDICRTAEERICPAVQREILPWTWMYLEVIIRNSRYDLLDRMVDLIYGKDDHDFTGIGVHCCTDLTYSEYICLLYRRYCPQAGAEEIAEKLLFSEYMWQLPSSFVAGGDMETEAAYILSMDFRTNLVNCLAALWLLSDRTCTVEELCRFLGDRPVLYLNNSWVNMCASTKPYKESFKFLTELVKNIPDIVISIDNFNDYDVNYAFSSTPDAVDITVTEMNSIFSVSKPVVTDKISENKFLLSLICSDSPKLKPLLKNLVLDEEIKNALVELSVEHKCIRAMDILNKRRS